MPVESPRIAIRDRMHQKAASGRNLACVLRYARKSPAARVTIGDSRRSDAPGPYVVNFQFDDGAFALTYWQDWRVALRWLVARRSWSIKRLSILLTGDEPFGVSRDTVTSTVRDIISPLYRRNPSFTLRLVSSGDISATQP